MSSLTGTRCKPIAPRFDGSATRAIRSARLPGGSAIPSGSYGTFYARTSHAERSLRNMEEKMGRKTPAWADQMSARMPLGQAAKTYDRALVAGARSDLTRRAYGLYIER